MSGIKTHISLKAQGNDFSEPDYQLELLQFAGLTTFQESLERSGLYPYKPTQLEILQINVGKMCNQVCKHCHVDAGPDRREIMSRETMLECLEVAEKSGCHTIDITGGAPEMNPDFKWFVEELSALGKKIIVRCNLTIIVANPKYHDLPDFYKKHNVELVSSLPYYSAGKTDAQRGEGVFAKSIEAMKMLNDVGYGVEGTGLIINLVYNPSGAFLPPDQSALERDFKSRLSRQYGLEFNNLFAITNLPVSRFLNYLVASDNYNDYMEKLVNAYNPVAASNAMCRNMLSVSWDGYLYDCDFNQMLELKIASDRKHIRDFNEEEITNRNIVISQHCYGCTAGAGSSCGGTTV